MPRSRCSGLRGRAASAQTVLVKMATLVPDGSSWHQILKETAEKWRTPPAAR